MENIAVGDKDTFNNLVSFCSSSEHSKYHTWYWILNNFQGMVRCIWQINSTAVTMCVPFLLSEKPVY